MSNIISNEKRHNQDKKKHILIHSQISAIKTQIKKTRITKSKVELNKAFKLIDSGVSKGIITKNKGNRLKSRLTLFVNDVDKKHIIKDTNKKKATPKKFDKNAKKNLKLNDSKKTKKIAKVSKVKIAKKNKALINAKLKANKLVVKTESKKTETDINKKPTKASVVIKSDVGSKNIQNKFKKVDAKKVTPSKPVMISKSKSSKVIKPIVVNKKAITSPTKKIKSVKANATKEIISKKSVVKPIVVNKKAITSPTKKIKSVKANATKEAGPKKSVVK